MSWIKRVFDGRHRRARAAEGAGHWRRAASLWAEAQEPDRAADALLHLAARSNTLEERLDAWQDALRFIPDEDEERRAEVERRIALALLDDARHRGAASAEEKRRLADAASRLERFDRPAEAAEAFAILGRTDDQARCLEAAGEVEKLEALLEKTAERDEREGKLRRLLGEYENALKYGARLEARRALHRAFELAPSDRSVAELLRRLEARVPPRARVRLSFGGTRTSFVGGFPAVLGRGDVEVSVRGTSVSRRHAEIAKVGEKLVLRDLDSRNGTLVRGVAIAQPIELNGDTEIGLGDDVRIAVRRIGAAVALEVLDGLDRGERVVIGEGELRAPELRGRVHFVEGWAVLAADAGAELHLHGQSCALPVQLLCEDRLVLGGVELEVVP